jgi:hypothetical protein
VREDVKKDMIVQHLEVFVLVYHVEQIHTVNLLPRHQLLLPWNFPFQLGKKVELHKRVHQLQIHYNHQQDHYVHQLQHQIHSQQTLSKMLKIVDLDIIVLNKLVVRLEENHGLMQQNALLVRFKPVLHHHLHLSIPSLPQLIVAQHDVLVLVHHHPPTLRIE